MSAAMRWAVALAAVATVGTAVPVVLNQARGQEPAASDAGTGGGDAGAAGDASPGGGAGIAPAVPGADDPRLVALKAREAELDAEAKRLEALKAELERERRELQAAKKLAAPAESTVVAAPIVEPSRERDHVAQIIKKMKPRDAAALMQTWADAVSVDILWRLKPRVTAPILAQMPPELAGRLTTQMALGFVPRRQPIPVDPNGGAP